MVDRLPVGRPVERDGHRAGQLGGEPRGPTRRRRTTIARADVELLEQPPLGREVASMSGWKSRWSWLRFVNAATAKWIPSTRRSSSACEETSIAQARSPASSIAAERRLEVDRLRRRAHRGRAPRRRRPRVTPPSRPHGRPGRLEQVADEVRRRRLAARAGDPDDGQRGGRVAVEARRGARHRGAHVVDEHLGDAEPERPRDDERRRAARDRVGGEVVPVAGEAGDAEEQRAGAHRAVVVGQGGDVHVGPVAEQVAQRHARAQAPSERARGLTGARRRSSSPFHEARTLARRAASAAWRTSHGERAVGDRGAVDPARQRAERAAARLAQPAGAERVGDRGRRVADEQRRLEREREVLDRAAREPLRVVAGRARRAARERVEVGVEPRVAAAASSHSARNAGRPSGSRASARRTSSEITLPEPSQIPLSGASRSSCGIGDSST